MKSREKPLYNSYTPEVAMNLVAIGATNSMNILSKALLVTISLILPIAALTQDGNRARDLGIPFEGRIGKLRIGILTGIFGQKPEYRIRSGACLRHGRLKPY